MNMTTFFESFHFLEISFSFTAVDLNTKGASVSYSYSLDSSFDIRRESITSVTSASKRSRIERLPGSAALFQTFWNLRMPCRDFQRKSDFYCFVLFVRDLTIFLSFVEHKFSKRPFLHKDLSSSLGALESWIFVAVFSICWNLSWSWSAKWAIHWVA